MRVPKISDICYVIFSLTIFVSVFNYSTKNSSDCAISIEGHFGCAKTKFCFNQVKVVFETATSTGKAVIDNIFFNGGSTTENSRLGMSENDKFKYGYAINIGEKKFWIENGENIHLYLLGCGFNKDGSKTIENKTVKAFLDDILFNGGRKNVVYVANGQINKVGNTTENSGLGMSENEKFKYRYAVNGGERKFGSETDEAIINLYLVGCGLNKDGSKTTENKDDFRKTILLFKEAKIKL